MGYQGKHTGKGGAHRDPGTGPGSHRATKESGYLPKHEKAESSEYKGKHRAEGRRTSLGGYTESHGKGAASQKRRADRAEKAVAARKNRNAITAALASIWALGAPAPKKRAVPVRAK